MRGGRRRRSQEPMLQRAVDRAPAARLGLVVRRDGALALDRRGHPPEPSATGSSRMPPPVPPPARLAYDASPAPGARAAPAPPRRSVRDRPRGARDAAPVRIRRRRPRLPRRAAPASASRLAPAGPPRRELVARIGTLHLQLPINQSRVTAIGYQGGTAGAIALDPLGTQANQGLLRAARCTRSSAARRRDPRWYQLPGGQGPSTSALDVGAAPAPTCTRRSTARCRDQRRRAERPRLRLADRHPADAARRRSSSRSRTCRSTRRSWSARP